MNRERFMQILEAYGGRESAWPAPERAAMQAYLEAHAEARTERFRARELDLMLDRFEPSLPDLRAPIEAALPPPSLPERLMAWLFPGGPASLLRPAMAGVIPLLLGAAVGLTLPGLSGGEDMESVWETQERYLLNAGVAEVSWYD